MDVRVKFSDDSTLNRAADLFDSLLVGPVLRTDMQYSIAIGSRPEATGHVIFVPCMWLNVPDKYAQFHGPRLNRSGSINSTQSRRMWNFWPFFEPR